MQIVLNNPKDQYLEVISIIDFDTIDETFKKFSLLKGQVKVKIFAINESVNTHQILELKKKIRKNSNFFCFYLLQ